jgi:hypothetical protein
MVFITVLRTPSPRVPYGQNCDAGRGGEPDEGAGWRPEEGGGGGAGGGPRLPPHTPGPSTGYGRLQSNDRADGFRGQQRIRAETTHLCC